MTQQEWEEATPDERAAEMERIKDPLYFYNNYYKVEGQKTKPLSQEEWDAEIERSLIIVRGGRRSVKTISEQITHEMQKQVDSFFDSFPHLK